MESLLHADRLLCVEDLATILQLSTRTIYLKQSSNPALLPPRTLLPGSRLLLWHPDDVRTWLRRYSLAETAAQSSEEASLPVSEKKRGGGRPRGAKNKPKVAR
jgi:predicted DNA-binding transcriptional regulator AlpA